MITDDQGYGDLSIHGNPHLETPNMDAIARQGVQFTQFQVCPVCSPTRSSLLTGRYNYRTGVVDTFLGRSMMYPDEVTLAELLRGAGYRTGIFGKWHLGDNYPMRPTEQGFEETLTHKGGGIGQPSDPPGGSSYFDPVLQRNGRPFKAGGYVTDVFFSAALNFIEASRNRPFFTYVATNAPHEPLQVADSLVEPFLKKGLPERTAKVYGMVKNIDDNIGRLLAHLKRLGIEQNTIVIFLTDNGPQHDRFNAGLRGRKGTVYQGGIRVPFFLRWPAAVAPGGQVGRIAAHIDVLPTLAEACGVPLPAGHQLDGRSLLTLLKGQGAAWPDRTLFTQWHRGDVPELFRACAARTQRYKLIDGKQLYDLDQDPAESRDIAGDQPDVVSRLRRETEAWYKDVSSTRGYDPPRIWLGAVQENPSVLTRQDWRGPNSAWTKDSFGYWEVDVRAAGRYEITLRFDAAADKGEARLKIGKTGAKQPVEKGTAEVRFDSLDLAGGPARLEPTLHHGSATLGVLYAEVKRL